jgi:hypothetical protein
MRTCLLSWRRNGLFLCALALLKLALVTVDQNLIEFEKQRNDKSKPISLPSYDSTECPISNPVMMNSSFQEYWNSRNGCKSHYATTISHSLWCNVTLLPHFDLWDLDDKLARQLLVNDSECTAWNRLPRYQSDSRIRLLDKGLHVAFLGDSVTRYQALALMHYLHTGHWISDSMVPSLLKDTGLASSGEHKVWNDMYCFTHMYFSGLLPKKYLLADSDVFYPKYFLTCDCYRSASPVFMEMLQTVVENRYYHDSCRGVSVYYFAKFGNVPFRGHYQPGQIHNNVYNLSLVTSPFQWQYESWSSFISGYLALLQPPPKYVIINAGLWNNHGLDNSTVFSEIRQALELANMTGIYKTTTSTMFEGWHDDMDATIRQMNHSTPFQPLPSVDDVNHPHDATGCNMLHHCLSLNWTQYITGPLHYSDNLHFQPHINTLFNEQLLDLLAALG